MISRFATLVLSVISLALGTTAFSSLTLAQVSAGYPTKPVRFIIPFPGGGINDVLARVAADKLSAKWGQPIIVENKTGAGGSIGADYAWQAEPDGYTFLVSAPGPLAINHSLYKNLSYRPEDFVPLTVLGSVPNLITIRAELGIGSVAELVKRAKANPGKLTYGSQGIGTTSHLTAELFKSTAGIEAVHVPYRGSMPALNGLLAGDVDFSFDNLGSAHGLISSGSIKLLAVASAQRLPAFAQVPTVAETLPGFVSDTWFAIAAPPKTSVALAERISRDVATALKQPEVIARYATLSAEPGGDDPAATVAFIREETERWAKVIKTAGIKME
jgi:tripartite-type tricarboxylate transporter receptor subunit TctC